MTYFDPFIIMIFFQTF